MLPLIMFHFEICGTQFAVGLKLDFSESWAHFEYNIYLIIIIIIIIFINCNWVITWWQ